jgi:hypothetical protein
MARPYRIASVVALVLLGSVAGALLVHPFGIWLAVGLTLYALALFRHPRIGLPAVLAFLPLLDFAPWTGWTLLNEFDLFAAVTVGMRLLRPAAAPRDALVSRLVQWGIGLVGLSFLVSAVIGLWPLAPLDANALYGPYTGWSSLRQFKGFAWALALLPLLVDEGGDPQALERRFTAGMLLGLSAVVAVILWQRLAFAGLLDFAEVYRVEGPFPELRAGGGDVHAYLVMAMPFLLPWVAERPTARRIAMGTTLFVLATYAIGVTFTRGAYVGYAVAFLILGATVARQRSPSLGTRFAPVIALGVAACVAFAVLFPIASGAFMEARLTGTQGEAATRARHWARTIEMMDPRLPTALFGMGLGAFPRTFLFRHGGEASATFRYEGEGDKAYLRLGSGRPLYLDQRVTVRPGETYVLSLDMRSSDPAARLEALLCEKSIQYSFRCQAARFRLNAPVAGWTRREVELPAGGIGSGPWPWRRPAVLSFTNPRRGTVVDLDNIRLEDASGRELIANGDFSEGGARWFSTADDHLPWHVFNVWVEIFFEQGWFGVLVVGALVAVALYRDAVGMWRGDLFAGALLATLGGFLAVGMTESLFDGPRVTMLFFLMLFLALTRGRVPEPRLGERPVGIWFRRALGSQQPRSHAGALRRNGPQPEGARSGCRISLHWKGCPGVSH